MNQFSLLYSKRLGFEESHNTKGSIPSLYESFSLCITLSKSVVYVRHLTPQARGYDFEWGELL